MIVREFIQCFLIDEIGMLKKEHPFHAFTLMATGIEFLGKCLSTYEWDVDGKSREEFNLALNNLNSFNKYRGIDQLYNKLRCGLAHLGIPKIGIKLDRESNSISDTSVVLGCEEFYEDFRNACIEIIENKNNNIKKNLNEDYAKIDGTITGRTESNK